MYWEKRVLNYCLMRSRVCNWWIGFLKAIMADLCTLTPWGPVQSRICQWRLTGCCMSAHLAEQGTQMAWQHPPVQRRTRSVHIHIQLSISIKLMPFTLEEHVSSQTSLTKIGPTKQKLRNANECCFNMTERRFKNNFILFWNAKYQLEILDIIHPTQAEQILCKTYTHFCKTVHFFHKSPHWMECDNLLHRNSSCLCFMNKAHWL